jgi:hypothetical protein
MAMAVARSPAHQKQMQALMTIVPSNSLPPQSPTGEKKLLAKVLSAVLHGEKNADAKNDCAESTCSICLGALKEETEFIVTTPCEV